jgi:hypothetical protein
VKGSDGSPIKELFDFFYDDIVEPLEKKGLVVDLEDSFPPAYPLLLEEHSPVLTGDL